MNSQTKTKTIKNLSNPRPVRRVSVVVILFLIGIWLMPAPKVIHAAAIPTVAVTLANEAVGAESRITIIFTPATALVENDTITAYVGELLGEDPFVDTGANVEDSEVTCSQSGTTFDSYVQTDATATVPMLGSCSVNTVGAGTGAVTMYIGDGAGKDLYNPAGADGYSVGIVTNDDVGAGIAYVGNANDVTVSATVLPNLALTISDGDGTYCTTTSGVTTCNLGVIIPTAITTGTYQVHIGTNATSGALMKVVEDTDLGVIDDVSDNEVTAGSEEYGISGAVTGGVWSLQGIYASGDDPIEALATVADSGAPVDITSSYVTISHKVSIASTTPPGTNSHVVTWTATASF